MRVPEASSSVAADVGRQPLGGEVLDHFAEVVVVVRQRAEHAGPAGEDDQGDAVAAAFLERLGER